jgi:hypothetical protein
MPNWCDNSISLTHKDPEMIKRAFNAYNDGKLLEEFIPVPDQLKEATASFGEEYKDQNEKNVAETGYASWYDYCIDQWGTKWDISPYSAEVVNDGLTLEGTFETAWAPPLEAYRKLEEMGFTIEATYYEPGMGFVGSYEDGEDDCYETPGTLEEAETIPEYLDERYGITEYLKEMLEQEEDEE